MRRSLALCGLLALTLLGCGRDREPPVDLSDARPAPADAAASADAVRFALSARASPERVFRQYERLLWHVGRKLGCPIEIVLRATYEESNALLERRGVDVLFTCSGPYVAAREKFGAEILVVPRVRGRSVHRSYIIVRRDSGFLSMRDLRGRDFAFTGPLSTTGQLYPTFLLRRMGTTPDRFFRKVLSTHGHDNSVLAVSKGLADGAGVDSLLWEDLVRNEPAAVGGLRVIARSPPFGLPPVAVHPLLAKGLKERLRSVFLALHEDEEGRRLLKDAGIDHFVLSEDSAYDGIRRMKSAIARGEPGAR